MSNMKIKWDFQEIKEYRLIRGMCEERMPFCGLSPAEDCRNCEDRVRK